MKARIYVNRHRVARNKKEGRNDPVIAIRTYKGVHYVHEAVLGGGEWTIRQDFKNPICSGATVWLEGEVSSDPDGIVITED